MFNFKGRPFQQCCKSVWNSHLYLTFACQRWFLWWWASWAQPGLALSLCILLVSLRCRLIYVWCGPKVLESEPVGLHIKVHVIRGGGVEKPVTGDASIRFSLKWLDHWFGSVCSGHLLILNKPYPPFWQQRWPLCIADIDSTDAHGHVCTRAHAWHLWNCKNWVGLLP